MIFSRISLSPSSIYPNLDVFYSGKSVDYTTRRMGIIHFSNVFTLLDEKKPRNKEFSSSLKHNVRKKYSLFCKMVYSFFTWKIMASILDLFAGSVHPT